MVPALYNDEEKEQIIGQVCCKTSASCSGSMLYDRFIGRHASFVQLYPIWPIFSMSFDVTRTPTIHNDANHACPISAYWKIKIHIFIIIIIILYLVYYSNILLL